MSIDVDNYFYPLVSPKEQLYDNPAILQFVRSEVVECNTYIPDTKGDGVNGKSLGRLCFVGTYAHLRLYMTRLVYDYRTFDDDHQFTEAEVRDRHKPLELRKLLIRSLLNDFSSLFPFVAAARKTYKRAFEAGCQVQAKLFFTALEAAFAKAREEAVKLENHDVKIHLYISRYGQKTAITEENSPFDFFRALEMRDENDVPRFPVLPTAVVDVAVNRYYPSPGPELEIPVVSFTVPPPANPEGEHEHGLPPSVADAFTGTAKITILTNGFRIHSHRYGWVTIRAYTIPIKLEDPHGHVEGNIVRVVIYPNLKHYYHAISLEDFITNIKSKNTGRTRKQNLEDLVDHLEELLHLKASDKAIILVQTIRTELKLMGHSFTNREQWIAGDLGAISPTCPAPIPIFTPNLERLARYATETGLSKLLGVQISCSHIPVTRMIQETRETLAKLGEIKGTGNLTKKQKGLLLEAANSLGYSPESVAVACQARKQVVIRGVEVAGDRIVVKCTKQRVTLRKPLPLTPLDLQRLVTGAALISPIDDSNAAREAKRVRILNSSSSLQSIC